MAGSNGQAKDSLTKTERRATELANIVLGQVLDKTADQRKAFIIAHDGLERRVRQLEGLFPQQEQTQAPQMRISLDAPGSPFEKNAVEKSQPPVFLAARSTRNALERVHGMISRLEEKLAPALSAPAPSTPGGGTAVGLGGTSALASEFGELLSGLEMAAQRLGTIIDRVEV